MSARVLLAIVGGLCVVLAGCGGDSKRRIEPAPNHAPVCQIIAAFVEAASQEIVIDVGIWDTDTNTTPAEISVEVVQITSTGEHTNDILAADGGGAIAGNRVTGVNFGTGAPGVTTRIRVSSSSPVQLPSDALASVRVIVRDGDGGSSSCTDPIDLSLLSSEPTCLIRAPSVMDFGAGIIDIDLEIVDPQGDLASLTIFYSLDGGVTRQLATLSATTVGALGAVVSCDPDNPGGAGVIDVPTMVGGAPTTLTISWDSLADGVALASAQQVTILVHAQDCTTLLQGGVFSAPCTQDTTISNNGAPICAILAPLAMSMIGGTGVVNIDFNVTDIDSAVVECDFEWSSDGGVTWSLATAAMGFTNPQSVAPGAGTFAWDASTDIPAAAQPVDVQIRMSADDLTGRPFASTCLSGVFTLVPVSEPTCAFTSPAASMCVDAFPSGLLSFGIDLVDAQGDPIRFSVCYTTGGAEMPATLTSTSNGMLSAYVPNNALACAGGANQVVGATAGATIVTWDFIADGVVGPLCTAVALTVYPEDGTTAFAGPFSACALGFSVSNNGAPSCTINSINDIENNFDALDADTTMVTATFEYSTDGGLTFAMATPSAGTNPRLIPVGAGLIFPWAATTDLPACALGVIARATVDDGVPLPNRPALCLSAPTDINCVPVARVCRTVDTLGTTAAGPTGVNPVGTTFNGGAGNPPTSGDIDDTNILATNFWNFDYIGLNQGAFNTSVQLTDAAGDNTGNPVVLHSAGHDYSGFMDGGVCNPIDTFAMVLEADIGGVLGDFSASINPFMGATITTTWMSSAPGSVAVSANGVLSAVAENTCAMISWTMASSDPMIVAIDPACAAGAFAACVDSGGVDTTTRAVWLPLGDIDTTIPGLPSGMPLPGIGSQVGMTHVVNSGVHIVAAYQAHSSYTEAVLIDVPTVDDNSIGGSTRPQIGLPFATNPSIPGQTTFSDVNTSAVGPAGIFDLATQTFMVNGSGTAMISLTNEELANPMACNIWVMNPCMPFSSFVCPMPPPPGGYQTIAGTSGVSVP